ncbi:hypothetical protein KL929_002931 [Ogataea haglerorum]|uniref:uncharacterized protein n=1 Tax=Ogataea haglerorum TaxID=1937702 RepID=UPI001C8A6042|nr:uncharacterized protein KL911_003814 [Ogataea haglerorum]KAG7747000.1 hypothetical protein KL912_003612 [Ogataea haglerorum]KAG7752532.1 hypothetical protein KL911_003814 [Ogataea haglerorum]KAG7788129.1 hypothetical protein KL945_002433 [Ogataea haglerorum]KAG7788384.1 hypothetical protein KL910_003012 [Ogataea haglerorum]KAG7797225.1 hypothetical protein KL929_002931 [Ogataea haglerorum]
MLQNKCEKDNNATEDSLGESDQDDNATLFGSNGDAQAPAVANFNVRQGTLDGQTLVNGEQGIRTENNISVLNGNSAQATDLARSQLSQLQYNENRISLDRSINTASSILSNLQRENSERPIYYPTNIQDETLDSKLNSKSSKLALIRHNSVGNSQHLLTEPRGSSETSNFELLKINLKIGPGSENLLQTLDKAALSQLLNEKFSHIKRHLRSLRDRIDDTSSKVLVTGDLNSGKSAFCNALLRRKVMPEDQQPCTNVFCEIIDARDNNNGIEEVHAVPIGSVYLKNDERTYKIFPLEELEHLVYQSEHYSLLIVYVTDNRPSNQSLLKNGVIDIKLIDAPGLNLDSYHTTQVFSRQEEIDLVVFVVNAENHFTLSGREFISSATNDKNLIFIVVNKFDNIRDQDKCKRKVMDQVHSLSPETYKNSSNFVHFVSSKEMINQNPGGDGPDGNPDEGDGPRSPDFDHLEASLRKFLVEKRSLSKLLPAKNYLVKLYSDLIELSQINEKLYNESMVEAENELKKLGPQYDDILQSSAKTNEKISRLIESVSSEVYANSRDQINRIINEVDHLSLGIRFEGYSNITEFARQVQERIIGKILEVVSSVEEHARHETSSAIDEIKRLGVQVLGEGSLPNTKFIPSSMYSKKRDNLQRHIENEVSLFDFVDPNFESFCKICGITIPDSRTNLLIGLTANKLWAGGLSSMAILYGPRVISTVTGIASISSYIPRFVVTKVVPGTLIGVAIGLPLYYLYKDAPHAYQRNVVKKIKKKIEHEDYQHLNSLRISKEVRKVLNYPAKDISNAFATTIEKQSSRRSKILSDLKTSEISLSFYRELTKQVKEQYQIVQSFDLESVHTVN